MNQDLHLAIEIFIETIFDFFHKAAHCLLSPSEAFRIAWSWFSSDRNNTQDIHGDAYDNSMHTDTLGENDPGLTEMKSSFHQVMNTDARTCQDVITELGYGQYFDRLSSYVCLQKLLLC